MPELMRFSNCKICIYADDHYPPHFHIHGPGWDVSVDLRTFGIMKGQGVSADIAEALQWATQNQAILYNEWGKLNERD
jgi:Domain of unknown function (DUF4160)